MVAGQWLEIHCHAPGERWWIQTSALESLMAAARLSKSDWAEQLESDGLEDIGCHVNI